MSFAKFFKDALLPVAVWTCGVLLSCFVLTVAGAPVSIVVVAVGVSFIFGMLGIVIEYARRRRFLRQLERAAEELESPAWVQEMVQCPTYAEGELEYENFNAAAATVTIHGFSVHPGSAKDTMINASNVAMEFHGALPVMARPETTEGRQGFYHLCQMYGDVTTAKLGYILRDHDAAKLQFKKDNMQDIADYLNGKYGAGTVEVEIKDSYRNMLEKIKPHFHLIETARKAVRMAGLEPVEVPVRGGTDGATLSWMGLPCPNLGTGGFNFHGVCECTTVERMDRCTEIVLNIISLYAE